MTSSSGTAVKATTLAIGSAVKFSMMPVGDKSGAGVDWAVTCAGNPVTGSIVNGACGTLAPAHTSDGAATVYTAPSSAPIGGAITVTATVTSNPSQNSSVSLTIVASPIGCCDHHCGAGFSGDQRTTNNLRRCDQRPVERGRGLDGDLRIECLRLVQPTIDATGNGTKSNNVYGSSVVPAGGRVTLIATSLTDTTKFASATLTITAPPPPVPVTVNVLPSSVYVTNTSGSAHSTSLTAIVSNDPATAGVDWSLSCGASSCGSLNASVTAHTASGVSVSYAGPSAIPPGGTVIITAKSTTNPAISASVTATIVTSAPIVISMSSAPPAALTAGTQVTLAATVTADPNNLGVNWTVSCGGTSGCGSFNLSPAHTASAGKIVYTAPASVPPGGLVTITASSPASYAIELRYRPDDRSCCATHSYFQAGSADHDDGPQRRLLSVLRLRTMLRQEASAGRCSAAALLMAAAAGSVLCRRRAARRPFTLRRRLR